MFLFITEEGVDEGTDHLEHHLKQLQAQGQLWLGTPDDLISWIKQYQAGVDSRRFVLGLSFNGMPGDSVRRGVRCLARDVMSEFRSPQELHEWPLLRTG